MLEMPTYALSAHHHPEPHGHQIQLPRTLQRPPRRQRANNHTPTQTCPPSKPCALGQRRLSLVWNGGRTKQNNKRPYATICVMPPSPVNQAKHVSSFLLRATSNVALSWSPNSFRVRQIPARRESCLHFQPVVDQRTEICHPCR